MSCALHLLKGCHLPDDEGPITIGSDEVGWGAVAGPLFVVGVALPRDWTFQGLRDSKKYTGKNRRLRREKVFERLIEEVRGHWVLSITPPAQIDKIGARRCLIDAHTSVLVRLIDKTPGLFLDRVIIDGNLHLPLCRRAVAIPKADDLFPVVSAASVIAKVLRDQAMDALAETYPQYGFEQNAGYETELHLKALKKHGLCPAHRRSYLKKLLPREQANEA